MPPRTAVARRVAWGVPGETSASPSAPVPSPLAAERRGETREGEGEAYREFERDGRALSRREVTRLEPLLPELPNRLPLQLHKFSKVSTLV